MQKILFRIQFFYKSQSQHYKSNLLLLLSCLVFIIPFSCKSDLITNSNLNCKIITYNISDAISAPSDSIYLTNICSSITYIPLQSTDETLLGRISKVIIDDSLIFVFEKDEKLLLFDLTGKFIREIGKKGNGPGEFVRPIYFEIDPINNLAILYDDDTRRILYYSYNSQLISVVKLKNEYFQYYIPFYNTDLLAYTMKPFTIYNENFNLGILSKNGSVNTRLLKRNETFDEREVVAVGLNKLYNYEDTISLWQFHYDTVYRILPNKMIIPKYVFDFKNSKMPMSYRNSKQFRINSTKYPTIRDVIEVKSYFFLKVVLSDGIKYLIIQKKNGNISQLGSAAIINNMDLRYNMWPEGKINDSTVYMCLNPIEMAKNLKTSPINNLNKEFLLKLKQVTLLDNPYIIIMKLK